ASSYLDKEEETWLKGVASQGAWAAVKEKEEKAVSGGKPLAVPVPQEPNPPDKYNDGVSTWWDIFDGDWWKSDEPWPPPFGPKWIPPIMSTVIPTSTPMPVTQTPTKTLHPDVATIIALQTANTPLPTRTPLPTATFSPALFDYGIETKGFDANGRQVVLNAANLTANKLLTISPELQYPHLAFAYIHGGRIQIILDPNYPIGDNDENCIVEVNKITCNTLPTEANLIHEFGHIFWVNQVAKGVNMMGIVNKIPMGDGTYLDYDTEGGFWFRQPDGFLRGEDSWEHKPNGDTFSGNAKVEQSADMFLNFIYDGGGNDTYGFSPNAAGAARREEMLKILYQVFGK
ncbi:MAG: hypothetical protein KDD74_02640, partial [Anaerolineales bacterium]|nr:hypothetical protein [Anaerolineales bacterium]